MSTKTETPSTPNYDPITAIHYGVISQHSLHPEAFSDIFNEATDLSYESAKEELLDSLLRTLTNSRDRRVNMALDLKDLYYGDSDERSAVADRLIAEWDEHDHDEMSTRTEDREAVWEQIEDRFNDAYQGGDGSHSWLWEKEGYKLMDCLDTDVFVIASKYYTFAPACSPCVPNAGNLDSAKHSDEASSKVIKRMSVDFGWLKTYCLSHDFFEGEQAPYPVFRVSDAKRVVMVEKKVECPTCEGTGRRNLQAMANALSITLKEMNLRIAAGEENTKGMDYDPILETIRCFRCSGAGHTVEKSEEEQE